MIENLTNISKTLILSSLIIIFISLIFTSYEVNGRSMQPTLESGDRVLVLRLNYIKIPLTNEKIIIKYPKKNSLVAFKKKDENVELVKRVIGLPQEEIDIKNRTVFIDGIIQEQGVGVTNPNADFPIIVEENCIFVLGDNRNLSNDSRTFGCVPVEDIDGQIAMR
ncbi:MAG: signal peptidase I, partial [Chloroflexota bacterium]|nr:signal peptidase I [Chloroflexota bacterium]